MIDRQQATSFTRKTLILWIGLTTGGYILGADLHYQMGPTGTFHVGDVDARAAVAGFLFGAISGLIIALLQWIALRRWIFQTWSWLALNIIAFGLVHALNDVVHYRALPLALLLAAGGLIAGLAQYLAMRRALNWAGWWIPVVCGTWVIAFQLGFAMGGLAAGNPLGEVILGHGTAGLVTGVITGVALKYMLKAQQPLQAGEIAEVQIAGG